MNRSNIITEDRPRVEARVKIRVECSADTQMVGGPGLCVLLRRGPNEVVIYESDLPKVEALVETKTADLERLTQRHAESVALWQDEREKETGKRPAAADYGYEDHDDRFPAQMFRREFRREVLPLRNLVVLEHLPIERDKADGTLQQLAAAVAQLAAAVAPATASKAK